MIRVRDSTRYHEDLLAIDHTSFEVEKEFFSGLNGAGKTITVRIPMVLFLRAAPKGLEKSLR